MRTHPFILQDNQPLTPTTRLLTLQSQDGSALDFLPGQYAGFAFRQNKRFSPVRCFSIVNSPDERGRLQFGIRTGGSFTASLAQLPQGTPFTVYGPYGSFVFNEFNERPLVFMAGGIGITPFISMLRYATAHRLNMPIILLYANRTKADIPFLDEIRQLAQANPRFSYQILLSQEDQGPLAADMAPGRITSQTLKQMVPYPLPSARYFICGPSPFMAAMAETLRSQSVPEESIVVESFSQIPSVQSQPAPLPKIVYATTAIALGLAAVSIVSTEYAKKTALAVTPASAVTTAPTPYASSNSSSTSPSATPDATITPDTSQPTPVYQPVQPRTSVS